MVEDSSLLPLARGLLERGLVIPLHETQLVRVQGKPLLNGLFGVGKGTRVGKMILGALRSCGSS